MAWNSITVIYYLYMLLQPFHLHFSVALSWCAVWSSSECRSIFPLLFQITINTTNAQPLGQQLVAFTSRAAHFTDVMDVIFVTHLVERLTRLVEKRRDVRVNTQRRTAARSLHDVMHNLIPAMTNKNLFPLKQGFSKSDTAPPTSPVGYYLWPVFYVLLYLLGLGLTI